jgi:hypothetical protein
MGSNLRWRVLVCPRPMYPFHIQAQGLRPTILTGVYETFNFQKENFKAYKINDILVKEEKC